MLVIRHKQWTDEAQSERRGMPSQCSARPLTCGGGILGHEALVNPEDDKTFARSLERGGNGTCWG
jgi:hypothetical protein